MKRQRDKRHDYLLVEGLRLHMAELYRRGVVLEMMSVVAHDSHHAWQIKNLFEAVMFDSILDRGALADQFDRKDESAPS